MAPSEKRAHSKAEIDLQLQSQTNCTDLSKLHVTTNNGKLWVTILCQPERLFSTIPNDIHFYTNADQINWQELLIL